MLKLSVHKQNENGDVITLLEELRVVYNGRILTVPAGFESDGASQHPPLDPARGGTRADG